VGADGDERIGGERDELLQFMHSSSQKAAMST